MNYKKITFVFCLSIFLLVGRNVYAQTDTTFKYTGSLQTWTVPCALYVTITAYGAAGGTSDYYPPPNVQVGGAGAEIVGTFSVVPGHVLDIMVGQKGGMNNEGSGGGGTFVWDASRSNYLMLAAGGGGGTYYIEPGGSGSADSVPTNGMGYDGGSSPGGTYGNGGSGGTCLDYGGGGGGAGWYSNGQAGGSCGGYSGGAGGTKPLSGGAGGVSNVVNGCTYSSAGGYGGGGASTCYAGGGGGGYNGGGGAIAFYTGYNAGGGGGSINHGTNQTNKAGVDTGNGLVTITWVPSYLSPTDTAIVRRNVNCYGNTNGEASAVLPAVGVHYIWAPGGQTTDTATGLSAGSYTLTVSDICGHSVTGAVTITQPNMLSGVTAVATENILCNGGNNGIATVSSITGGGSPFTYSWSDPNLQATISATGLTAGSYTVTVTDICGETTSTSVTITQPNTLTVAASAAANVNCNGNDNGTAMSTVTNGTAPYTYSWSDINLQTTASATGLTIGTYTVNVVDNHGCTGSASVTISQPNELMVSAIPTTAIACNGKATGGAASSVSGGTAPYTYAWTAGGGNGANASTLRAGFDTVTVVDAHGCTASAVTTITQPEALSIIRHSTVDHGNCQAAAWVVVSGGVASYSYVWSNNGNTTYYINSLCHGSYCCTVTDANGCADSVCISVTTDLGVGNINGNAGQITVYPNPNSGQFTIEAGATNGASSVEIYNVLGEKVYTTGIAANKGGATVVNISNQPNGIYLYRVISNDNGSLLGEGKIILQK